VNGLKLGPHNYFVLGDWRFTCDECGDWPHASVASKRWDNAMVCPKCWEIRNPQDFIRGIPDRPTPPWTRPVPPATFLNGNGSSGTSGGSAIVGDPLGDESMLG
jgi:hypothetical protein